jgi:hypothetical protein
MEFIIHESGGDGVPPGTYQGVFDSFDCELETSKGKAIRWAFKADDGRTIDGISDRESKPTTKNKTGRWLAAVDPTQYIGKRYLLIVSDGGGGKGKLDTFSRLE